MSGRDGTAGFRREGRAYIMAAAPIQILSGACAMAILKIARMGHPVLLQPADPVADPGAPEIRRLVADMIETMEDAPGIGLAAPQVHVPLRIFVFRVPAERAGEGEAPSAGVVINPVVEGIGEADVLRWEGCLSIPGLRGAVPRFERVRYAGVDCDSNPVGGVVGGMHANVVQHENDHLDGILYPMRIIDFSLFGFAEEMARHPPAPAADTADEEEAS